MVLSSMVALAIGMAQAGCVAAPAPDHKGASALAWYVNGDEVAFHGKKYGKYGLPRVLHKDEVALAGPYKGGYFYAEKGVTDHEILYLLTRIDGCEFQPYAVK